PVVVGVLVVAVVFIFVESVPIVVVVVDVESVELVVPCVLLSLQDQIPAANRQATRVKLFFFIKDFLCVHLIEKFVPAIRCKKMAVSCPF
ncbi:MAG: hypothetical protein ACXVBT_13235, partial [Flavisolibacter sp.]